MPLLVLVHGVGPASRRLVPCIKLHKPENVNVNVNGELVEAEVEAKVR